MTFAVMLAAVAAVVALTRATGPSECDAIVSFAHGTDVKSGGSVDQPFKTIAFAVTEVPRGRVCLRSEVRTHHALPYAIDRVL